MFYAGTGEWNIDVNKCGSLPEKLATGFAQAFSDIQGASYTPLVYVGSQIVNGINYAIVAEQALITNPPIKNIVLIILNEKPIDEIKSNWTIVSIDPIISGSDVYGSVVVDPKEIDNKSRAMFNVALEGIVGATYKPLYLVASQIVHGVNYTYLAQQNLATVDNAEHLVTVTINVSENGINLVSISTVL